MRVPCGCGEQKWATDVETGEQEVESRGWRRQLTKSQMPLSGPRVLRLFICEIRTEERTAGHTLYRSRPWRKRFRVRVGVDIAQVLLSGSERCMLQMLCMYL